MNLLVDQTLDHGKLKEFLMSSLVDQKLEQENMQELMAQSLMNQQLNQDDGVTEKCVNQSGTTENGSEHAVCQVKVQEKVVTTWLFDTGADAHVMPKCVWEQLGEPTLQTTSVTLRGANGQDLGATGEVQVRGFIGKSNFSSQQCTRRETMSSEWNTTQNEGIHVHFESTRKFPHSTERRPKCNNVTRRKPKHTQSCMLVETKRDTVGNLPDVER